MTTIRADDIIDRQRLRKKVTFWRIMALLALIIAVFSIIYMVQPSDGFGSKSKNHIAQVKIEGAITEDEALLERLENIEQSDFVKGVILTIDSPGGTTVGGEAIYNAVREIAEKKPVVAQIGTLAASAGYMVASATDQIVARNSSIVGSIGVIFQYPNFQGLLDNLGVDMRAIKSSPMKAEPSFYGETPPEAETMIKAMILDSFDWFKGIVTERRGFTKQKTDELADGSIFTGRQALQNGLIDQVGGQDVARAWLTEKGIDDALEIVEWKRQAETSAFPLSGLVTQWFFQKMGLGGIKYPLSERIEQSLMLDGLLSIWHVKE